MRKFKYVLLIAVFLVLSVPQLKSFAPRNKSFGFGIMVGEPTALTIKIWTSKENALVFSLGNSYFGSLRIGADYLWHFNSFNSNIVNLYAGPGVAIGIGESGGWWYHDKNRYWYKGRDEISGGVRGVFGINIVPKRSPIEIFGEIGVMVGMLPSTHANLEGAIGIRFYP